MIGLLRQKLYINGATATVLVVLAFAATGAGEFVREGVRKPFTIRNVLYSNAIPPSEVARMRREGSVTGDPYPLRGPQPPTEILQLGARVFRRQCAVCHSTDGANGVLHLVAAWTPEQMRINIAQLQRTKAFMPPFAGSAHEVESLVQWLLWQRAGEPANWTNVHDPETLATIEAWLDEAGVAAGSQSEDPR